jgi:hypothetical protein
VHKLHEFEGFVSRGGEEGYGAAVENFLGQIEAFEIDYRRCGPKRIRFGKFEKFEEGENKFGKRIE